MIDEIPDLPGYVSTREAAKMLGVSERRIRLYIEMKRLPAVRAAKVFMIPVEHVENFKRKIVGRPRKSTLAWRISSLENTQFMTSISVQVKSAEGELSLRQRIEEVKRSGRHIFPGTVARYVVSSETIPRQIEIVLVWRSTVMPNELEREQALEALRQALADVLDWETAQYNNGEVLMHT
jgi:excisionase family DNA binding protein